ncbi:excisionase family protein, partial [Enterobacter ludwigii]|uniref:excisionase family protein n=1 Tax=Enterobacter ludwigii TaxID=299767 RepID=UPI001B35C7E0
MLKKRTNGSVRYCQYTSVSEEQLIALKGIKKGTLKKAREKSFMEGSEYKHVAHDGMP